MDNIDLRGRGDFFMAWQMFIGGQNLKYWFQGMVKFYAFLKIISLRNLFPRLSLIQNKNLSRTKLGFIETITLYFKFLAGHITVLYQKVSRKENYLLIVT